MKRASPRDTVASSKEPVAFILGLREPGLAAARALGRAGVPVVGVDSDPTTPGFRSRYCAALRCPSPIHDPEEVVRFLIGEARSARQQPVVILAADSFVKLVFRHRDELSPYFRFALPPPAIAEAFVDKRLQYALAEKVGMPYPRTLYPETAADVQRLKHDIDYPAFIKGYESFLWREHYGGAVQKGFKVESPAEMVARFGEIHSRGLRALVQSIVIGPARNHVKVSAYLDASGEALAVFTVRKLRQNPPEFGLGCLVESYENPALAEMGLRFLRDIGYRGFASIELKRDDRDDEFKLIEVNPRCIMHHALMIDAGMNFPLIEYLDVIGRRPRPQRTFRSGVRWWNAPEDIKSFLTLRRGRKISLREWVGSWIGARSFATFAPDDPLPTVAWYGGRLLRLAASRAGLRGGRPARARDDAAAAGRTAAAR